MENCLFCKIAAGEIPSHRVYENDKYFAFLDIHPKVKGHVLVIPKDHHVYTYDVPNFGEYWEITRMIAMAVQKGMDARWINFVTHGEIPHAHIHIFPRDGQPSQEPTIPPGVDISKEEMEVIKQKIIAAFQ